MSLASLMSETVTWLKYTPGAPDSHGVPVDGWTDNGVLPAYVQPSGSAFSSASQETLGGRDTVVSDFLVVIAAGPRLGAADRLSYRGLTLEIVGDPLSFHKPGSDHHVEITARSVKA